MKQKFFIFIILALSYSSNSQVNHFLGLGLGQTRGSATDPIDHLRAEIEINYSLSYKLLIANAKITTLPMTAFGIENRFFLNLGFTTPQHKLFSFQFLVGFGYLSSSKNSYTEYDSSGGHATYTYINIGSPSATSSIFVNPFKNKRLLFGLQALIFREWVAYGRHDLKAIPVSYGVNLFYLLNSKKRENKD